MTYNANNLPPPNGPQFTAPPGAQPDPDRPRARYVFAHQLVAGDRIFITHKTGSTEFDVSREVESVDVGMQLVHVVITFRPKRGADVQITVDSEQRFRVFELAPRETK